MSSWIPAATFWRRARKALGYSRGGVGTKLGLNTDYDRLPIAFERTGGYAGNSPKFSDFINAGVH